ncbi:hypothetical protein TSUD_214070 [Trifolium subterraneum]|uniref:Uncharacterized protein n=1 Tax=Trifolium subterraneum TaxID=3900 RepID=A0A2Z6N5H4_TRISU|nr:hypothetical protein TSUD_214070 [Trifolium subterraneum]
MKKLVIQVKRMNLTGFYITLFSNTYSHINRVLFYRERILSRESPSTVVHKIPESFQSATDYKNSFIPLLFEETRADLFSSLYGVSQAPFCEIANVSESRRLTTPFPEVQNQFIQFHHVLWLKSETTGNYKPVSGDLIALTHIRPKGLSELNTLESPYRIAYVKEARKEWKELPDRISVLTSKCMKMDIENDLGNNKELSSKCMKMEIRYDLWNNKELKLYAVHLMNMTTNVRIWDALNTISRVKIMKTMLGPSQIVAIRLHRLVMDSLEHDMYGLGDIVLFGHNKRMKLGSHTGLDNVFLDNRVEKLMQCFNPNTGWKTNLQYMIELLESMKESANNTESMKAFKEEFGKQREKLTFLMQILYTHISTSLISPEMVKEMLQALDLLRRLGISLSQAKFKIPANFQLLQISVILDEVCLKGL